MAVAILDHLWQSTLLALGAWLLAAVLRKARAGVRYGLWFAASAKFLVPFAALAALGGFAARAIPPAPAGPEVASLEKVALPLSRFPFAHVPALEAAASPEAGAPAVHAAPPVAPPALPHIDLMTALAAVWALGFAAILIRWMIRWRRVRRIARSAVPLDWPAPMPVRASPSLMEPGLVGLLRPVLVTPATLMDRLTREEIDAVLAHEVSHLRRRDNLTAAVHMLVEALFWFHPLVWWIGARLIEERERACDEAVVAAGHDRAVYARALIESCRVYLQSPLSCAAGASGSNLKMRVEAIMTARLASPLSAPTKALLLAAGAFAFATPVAAGLLAVPAARQATVRAMVAVVSPARPLGQALAADDGGATKPVVQARNAVIPPAPSVAGANEAPLRLAEDLAAPSLNPAQAQTSSSGLAVQAPAAAPARPAAALGDPEPADAKAQALRFVQAYAATTPQRQLIARWAAPICVRVVGLARDQIAAVTARVEQVARGAGVPVGTSACRPTNIEIGFTDDPQRMLDGVIRSHARALGDSTSGTGAVRTVTAPIQAWYLTNGVEFADAGGAVGLKALAVYQGDPRAVYQSFGTPLGGYLQPPPQAPISPPEPPETLPQDRQFLNVFVIVDLRRTGALKLGLTSDYVAMLALSQPRSLDHCNVLPSVTDLFADPCPGRAAPSALTPADVAYLTALYAPVRERSTGNDQFAVARRMAILLSDTKLAAR